MDSREVEAGSTTGNPRPDGDITRLLQRAVDGEDGAAEDLLSAVYEELRRIARWRLLQERASHTLQPTALVNEAYLRLFQGQGVAWDTRAHFYGAASRAMRQILVDHARKRAASKRGGGRLRLPMNLLDIAGGADPNGILEFDDALRRFQAEDPAAGRLIQLRFFAGLNVAETAAAMGMTRRAVQREWAHARVRLFELLERPIS